MSILYFFVTYIVECDLNLLFKVPSIKTSQLYILSYIYSSFDYGTTTIVPYLQEKNFLCYLYINYKLFI